MAKKKQTQAEKIAKMDIEKISKISNRNRKQLEDYVKKLQYGYKRRVQQFQNQGLVSHAQISLEGSSATGKRQPLNKMSRNQLILEFAKYQKFFNSKTSTVEGIKEVNREQDIRIFGKDNSGKPLRTMTEKQRQLFWQTYEEYENQEPTGVNRYGYGFIWNQLGEMIIQGDEITEDNLILNLNRLREKLDQSERRLDIGSVPNVYSGKGPSI